MTFLNPAILWGLAAVSIPILIHIFNLKKTKKIEFSTLMFLKEIQQSKYKKIKLKQLLILLCRIAMTILLVLAFSRPFETGYLGAGEKAKSSVLLILDNSFSMQARTTGGNCLDIAKKKLQETLGLMDEKDEVYFSTVSDLDKPWKSASFQNHNDIIDSSNNSKISDVTRDFNEVLYYAEQILSSSSNPYKEIFLFTDGQKSFIEGKNQTAYVKGFDGLTYFNIVLCSSREGNNISLDTINTVTKIFEQNRNVKLKCTVNNRNSFDVQNKSVVLNFQNGKYRDEKNIDIPANSSVDVEFNFTPHVTGFAGGYIELIQSEIADDEVTNDNKRYFAFKIPDKVNLLLVSYAQPDLDYVMLALRSSEELMRDSLNNKVDFFNIKQTGTNNLSGEDFNKYNCIVIADMPSFSQSDADKLYNYVQSGGGVIIYPGSNTDIKNYNEVFMKRFGFPHISGTYGNLNGTQTYSFDKIDFEHPVFEGIFKKPEASQNEIQKESPRIKYGLELLSGNNTLPIIKLNNEKNFLNEYSSGRGKILFYSVSPDMTNSDFPASMLFSPLTVRSILYLSNSNPIQEAVDGQDYFLDFKKFLTGSSDSITVSGLQHRTDRSIPVPESPLINMKPYLGSSSIYFLGQAGKTVYEFPSNFDKAESGMSLYDDKEIEKYIKSRFDVEVNTITFSQVLEASILELRKGKEIWQYFLFGAIFFLILEYLISRSFFKAG